MLFVSNVAGVSFINLQSSKKIILINIVAITVKIFQNYQTVEVNAKDSKTEVTGQGLQYFIISIVAAPLVTT